VTVLENTVDTGFQIIITMIVGGDDDAVFDVVAHSEYCASNLIK
jgi:hypothetical protein